MKAWVFYIFAQVSESDLHNLPQGSAGRPQVENVLNIVFGIAGAVALLFIVIGGLKYVISQGNPTETAKAKDTILYALIGLVVVLLAFSIVSFVIGRI